MSPDQTVIKNKVKQYADSQDLDRDTFIAKCLNSKKTINGRKLKAATAARVYDGDTEISLTTAGLVAAALGVSVGDIFDIK